MIRPPYTCVPMLAKNGHDVSTVRSVLNALVFHPCRHQAQIYTV